METKKKAGHGNEGNEGGLTSDGVIFEADTVNSVRFIHATSGGISLNS